VKRSKLVQRHRLILGLPHLERFVRCQFRESPTLIFGLDFALVFSQSKDDE
jgi:hypothetical protein